MARRFVVALGICLSALALPCAALGAASTCSGPGWPQVGGSASHSGSAPPGARIGARTIGELRRVWRAPIGYGNGGATGIAPSPLEVCGTLYVAAEDGRVYAFDAMTGQRVWRTSAVGGRFFGAAIAHGTLFAIATGALDAYATRTGRLLWSKRLPPPGGRASLPLAVGSTVYVPTGLGLMIALDATTGAVRWLAHVGSGFVSAFSAPAAANGEIFAGVGDNLEALDATTGVVRWSAATGGPVWSTPTISDGTVYVGSNDDSVYAFDAATGTPRWSAPTGDRVYTSSPVAAATDVYVGSLDNQVHAFDSATGAPSWSFLTADDVTGSPTVSGGVVFVGSRDGKLYALDARTGSPLWSDAVGAPIGSSPAIDARSVYIATDRALVAYRIP
jgi:outer membrane protein assembly factor BamB